MAHEDDVAVLEAFVLDNPEVQRVEATWEKMEGMEIRTLSGTAPRRREDIVIVVLAEDYAMYYNRGRDKLVC